MQVLSTFCRLNEERRDLLQSNFVEYDFLNITIHFANTTQFFWQCKKQVFGNGDCVLDWSWWFILFLCLLWITCLLLRGRRCTSPFHRHCNRLQNQPNLLYVLVPTAYLHPFRPFSHYKISANNYVSPNFVVTTNRLKFKLICFNQKRFCTNLR